MFKSIESKLIIYLILLIVFVAGSTFCAMAAYYEYLVVTGILALFSIIKLCNHYNKFSKNLVFLLNAIENGDFAFQFTEANLSKREKELNIVMNRIKDILIKAKIEVVENERFLGLIIESVSTGIIILNDTNHIQTTNRATNQILGLPVFTHLNQLKTLNEGFPILFRDLEEGDQKQIKICNEREEVQVSLRASKIKLKTSELKIITLNNIGNELEAKEMESWVKLIRVMTHEIMNSIAPITSLVDTLLFAHKTSPNDKELRANTVEAFKTIGTTAKGLINFVESYRQFTGVPQPQLNLFDVVPLVNKLIRLEKTHLDGRNITFNIESPESLLLNADQNQISQILINLIKNAIESISREKEGKISLRIERINKQTCIKVCNNGEPISAEVTPHIFIPFFTTKEKGTGIGLSVSRYIMRLHGGNLKHHTQGESTIFSMEF